MQAHDGMRTLIRAHSDSRSNTYACSLVRSCTTHTHRPAASDAGAGFGTFAVGAAGFGGLPPGVMVSAPPPGMGMLAGGGGGGGSNGSGGGTTNEGMLEDAAATLLKIASTDDLLALGTQHFSPGAGGIGGEHDGDAQPPPGAYTRTNAFVRVRMLASIRVHTCSHA